MLEDMLLSGQNIASAAEFKGDLPVHVQQWGIQVDDGVLHDDVGPQPQPSCFHQRTLRSSGQGSD
jgi:hypothetical protein